MVKPEKGDFIMTVKGFVKLYHNYQPVCKTFKAAYEKAEHIHEKNFGSRRYHDYQTFIRALKKTRNDR